MIFLYLLTIAAANVITAACAPLTLFGLIIPAGSVFVGLTFLMRDLVQMKHGAKNTTWAILMAAGFSAGFSVGLGDTAHVAAASIVAFLVSELVDTLIYTMLRSSFYKRVVMSGVVGGLIDSGIFVVLGLSPIGMGALTWEQVPFAILGQSLVKALMQPMAATIYIACVQKRNKKR